MTTALVYIAALCAANALIAWLGPWVSVFNSFVLIGLDLALRDRLHDRYGFAVVVWISVVAGIASYALNPAAGSVALASSLSFTMAAIADGGVYQRLMRHRWLVKSNTSNAAGAAVDSLLFPLIAFGAFMPAITAGQFLAKVAGGFGWSLLLRRNATA